MTLGLNVDHAVDDTAAPKQQILFVLQVMELGFELAIFGTPRRPNLNFSPALGDSVNDAPAFAAFRPSFGVANVRRAVPLLSLPPRFIAKSERGAGFAEIVDALLAARA